MDHPGKKPATGASDKTARAGKSSTAAGRTSRAATAYSGQPRLDRSATGAVGNAPEAHDRVTRARGSSGTPLPEDLGASLSAALGTGLPDVRVHDNPTSHRAAAAVSAKAYTVGQDIHFAAGQYDPSSTSGQRLIAHEVAHTVQQRGASAISVQTKLEVSSPTDAHERESDAFADAFVAGGTAPVTPGSVASGVHRDADDDADESFAELKASERRRLFRAATVEKQIEYLDQVNRNKRRALFQSLSDEPARQVDLLVASSKARRKFFLEKLTIHQISRYFIIDLVPVENELIIYRSLPSVRQGSLVQELGVNAADLFKASTVGERADMVGMLLMDELPALVSGLTVADLVAILPTLSLHQQKVLFVSMSLDKQNDVALSMPELGADGETDGTDTASTPTPTADETPVSALLEQTTMSLIVVSPLVDLYRMSVDTLQPGSLRRTSREIALSLQEARTTYERAEMGALLDEGGGASLGDVETVREHLALVEKRVARSVGPHLFQGVAITGMPPSELPRKDLAAYLRNETAAVVELLDTVGEIKELLGADPAEAESSSKERAVSKVETWRSKFASFQFLRRVLTKDGLYEVLRDVKGTSGAALKDTAEEVVAEWRRLGEPKPAGSSVVDGIKAFGEYFFEEWVDLQRYNPVMITVDVVGAVAQGVGDATGLYDLDYDPLHPITRAVDDPEGTAETVAGVADAVANPQRTYERITDALAETMLEVEQGNWQAIGTTAAVFVEVLLGGAEDLVIRAAYKYADDVVELAGKLAKIPGADDTVSILKSDAQRVRRAAGAAERLNADRAAGTVVGADSIPELKRELGVEIEVDPSLGNGVEVKYKHDSKSGNVEISRLRVGDKADVAVIRAHKATMKRMQRYNGLVGELRRLWDDVVALIGGHGPNPFKPGTAEWNAWHEVLKLDDVMASSRLRLETSLGNQDLVDEIAHLERARDQYAETVALAKAQKTETPGVDHVGSPDTLGSAVPHSEPEFEAAAVAWVEKAESGNLLKPAELKPALQEEAQRLAAAKVEEQAGTLRSKWSAGGLDDAQIQANLKKLEADYQRSYLRWLRRKAKGQLRGLKEELKLYQEGTPEYDAIKKKITLYNRLDESSTDLVKKAEPAGITRAESVETTLGRPNAFEEQNRLFGGRWRGDGVDGMKVYKRDDLIDIQRLDKEGRTNLQRMKEGIAPVGPDGKSLELHHLNQSDAGPVVEITKTFHTDHYDTIHINDPHGGSGIPSGIDRPGFDSWKKKYWKNRAEEFAALFDALDGWSFGNGL